MKKIKTYNNFINESLKDKLKGKSKEEIDDALKNEKTGGLDFLLNSVKYNYLNGVKKALKLSKWYNKGKRIDKLYLETALDFANQKGFTDIIKVLLKEIKIDKHMKNYYLFKAALNNYEDLVEFYIDNGANIKEALYELNDLYEDSHYKNKEIDNAINLIKKYYKNWYKINHELPYKDTISCINCNDEI